MIGGTKRPSSVDNRRKAGSLRQFEIDKKNKAIGALILPAAI